MEDLFVVAGTAVGCLTTLYADGVHRAWRYIHLAMGLLPLLMTILIALGLLLESPRYLHMVGRKDEAEKVLSAWIGRAEFEQVLASWRARESEPEEGPQGWSQVLWPPKGQSMRRISASVGCMVAGTVSGCITMALYGTSILSEDFSAKTAMWITLWSLVGRFVVNMYIVFRIDTIGRRPLLLLSAAACSATYVYLAVAYVFDCSPYVKVAGYCLFQMAYAVGLGPVPLVYACEAVDTDVRSKAVASGFMVARLYAGIWTFSFSQLQETICDEGIFMIFAVLNAASCWFLYKTARETSGVQLEDMAIVFS